MYATGMVADIWDVHQQHVLTWRVGDAGRFFNLSVSIKVSGVSAFLV